MIAPYRVEEAKRWQVGRAARAMRAEHRRSMCALGFAPHVEMRSVFDRSSLRRACLIETRVVALWGLVGTLLSPDAFLWCAFAPEAVARTGDIMKEARRQMTDMMDGRREISTSVAVDDPPALRFALWFGFAPVHPETGAIPSLSGTVGERARTLMGMEEYQTPLGAGRAYAMVCRGG